MDKETLSNYGWIVICVLVLAVMIALATPFGTFVADAIKSTTQGLFDVNQSALNSTGLINIDGQEFENCDHDYEVTTTGDCSVGQITTTQTCKLCGKASTETLPAEHTWDGLKCTKCNTSFTAYSFTPDDYDSKMVTTTATDSVVVIPETFEYGGTMYKVTKISTDAFQNNTSITSVTIPKSVTEVGSFAFDGCENLESVFLSEGLNTIGAQAFARSQKIKSVVIPDSVTYIGQSAFADCPSLETISITPNSNLKTVGLCAFAKNKVTTFYFPDTVTSIGLRTFGYCYELKDVILSQNLTSISEDLFLACTKLEAISIPKSVKSIGKAAFKGCTSLTSITFEGTVEQWNAISLGSNWNKSVPATYVQCSDGQVPLS